MIALFRKRRFLDEDDEAWHLATWKFLLDNYGGLDSLRETKFVNATRAFFPPTEATGHARAEHMFGCVKKLAGMDSWPCVLMAQPERIRTHVSEFVHLRVLDNNQPLGTFGAEDGEVVITYDVQSLNNPAVLVATLSHELAHYLLATKHNQVPGGEEMHEFATDLTTVFLGFGLFGANRAFEFSQHGDSFGQGWRTSGMGYLRERDWVFALAVFQALRSEKAEQIKALLKPHLYVDLKKAERYLAKNPALLAELRA
jgi:hypothetical protein